MTALGEWLDSLPEMLTTPAAGNVRTYRALGGSAATPGTDRPRLIVIHTMETPEDDRARSTARWVQAGGGPSKVSTHFVVDNDEAIRCVRDEHVAFTQLTPWNDMSLSIEQAGRAASTAPDWQDPYSVGQRALVAKIVAAWSERWGIPLRFLGVDDLVEWRTCTGVTTHHQLSLTSRRPELLGLGYKPGDHWDPGPNYPMDQMLAEARAHLGTRPIDPSPPPVLPADPDEDTVTLYASNAETRTIDPELEPETPRGTWAPGIVTYAIDAGRIRHVRQGEDKARQARNIPAAPLTNDEITDLYRARRDGLA